MQGVSSSAGVQPSKVARAPLTVFALFDHQHMLRIHEEEQQHSGTGGASAAYSKLWMARSFMNGSSGHVSGQMRPSVRPVVEAQQVVWLRLSLSR